MGSKFEFDDTRENTGINKLGDDERKDLLDRFKSAGGQVINEKELHLPTYEQEKSSDFSTSSGRRQRGSFGLPEDDESFRKYSTSLNSTSSSSKVASKASGSHFKNSIAFFFLRLRAMFAGVTQLNGKMVNPSLIRLLAIDLRQALVEFNLLGNDLFLQSPQAGKRIAQLLDEQNPLYLELIEKAHQLFQKTDFDALHEAYENYGSSYVPIESIFPSVKDIYAKLYIVYGYQNTLAKAFQLAIDIFLQNDKDTSLVNFDDKKKRVEKDINKIFLNIFPKIFTLICVYDKTAYEPFSRHLEKNIGIQSSEQPGKRNRGDSSFLSLVGDDEEQTQTSASTEDNLQAQNSSVPQEEEETMLNSKEFEYGINLMNALDLQQLRKTCDPKNHFSALLFNDKAFLAYLFFVEFDGEYSIVLTSNQIKLNVATESDGGKKDYKRLLSDLYDESRKIHASVENYQAAREKMEGLHKNPLSSNYIENSKSLSSAQSRVDIEGRSVRGMIRYYMNNVVVALGELIQDMQNNNVIVANSADKLQFNPGIEGKKKMNGKSVENAIVEAYCYALALKERLENGDLFGGVLEMTEEEMVRSFGKSLLVSSSTPAVENIKHKIILK